MSLTKVNDRGLNYPLDLLDNEKIRLGAGLDLEIYHNGTNSQIDNNFGDLNITSDIIRLRASNNEQHIACLANGAVELYHNNSKKLETASHGVSIDGNLDFPDNTSGNASLRFGNSQDFFMNHNGSDSYIINNTGDLYIRDLNGDVHIQGKDNEESIIAKADGAVELYHNNVLRLETRANDVKFHGGLIAIDNIKLQLGSSGDLQLYHDGTNSYIDNINVGILRIRGNTAGQIELQPKGGEYGLITKPNGATELYFDHSKKLETVSGGVYVYGQFIFGVGTSDALFGGDNNKIILGSGSDLQIYHDGTHSRIKNGTGFLALQSDSFRLYNAAGSENMINGTANGAVELYYDNSKKFETTDTGAKVTGTLVADNAIGRNILINGSMRVAQRATSKSMSNAGSTYDVCDRWIYNRNGVTANIAQVDEAPSGSGFTKSFKWTSTSAVSSISAGNMVKFNQRIETQDIKRLGYGASGAKTATLSFWIRGSLTGKVGINCARDSRTFSTQVNYDTANTWRYFEVIIPADTSTGFTANNTDAGFDLSIVWGAGANFTSGTTGGNWTNFHTAYASGFTASDQGAYLTTSGSTFQLTGVQLEVGNKATAFEHLPFTDELTRCQRYYEVIKGASYNESGGEVLISVGQVYQTNRVIGNWQYKVEKRARPSLSTDDPSEVQALKSDAGWYSAGSFGGNTNRYATRLDLTGMPGSPMTEGQAAEIRLINDARVHISSEL